MGDTDQDLVARVRAGDSGAFRPLVERHAPGVFRLACRMTGETDAEDVVQETLLRAFRQLDKYESRSSFGTWIHRIAANLCFDLLRVRARRRAPALDDVREPACPAPRPDRIAIATQARAGVLEALDGLTVRERAAFLLRHWEGFGIDRIAEVLEISETAAKNTVFRAVRKMRASLAGRF